MNMHVMPVATPATSRPNNPDKVILALVPRLMKAHAAQAAAIDAYSDAEERECDATKNLERPERPRHQPASAWPNGVPIIAGTPLPVSSEEEWAEYQAAQQVYDDAIARARVEAGVELAAQAADDAESRLFAVVSKILALPAHTMDGLRLKLSLLNVDRDLGLSVLTSVVADIEAMSGGPIDVLK